MDNALPNSNNPYDLLFTHIPNHVNIYIIGNDETGKQRLADVLTAILRRVCTIISPDIKKQHDLVKSFTTHVINSQSSFLQNCDSCVFFFLYDISSPQSLSSVTSKIATVKGKDNIYLIGNKIDLEYWRKVSVYNGVSEAKSVGAIFLEISSLTGQHVDYLVDVVLKEMYPILREDSITAALVQALTKISESPADSDAWDMDGPTPENGDIALVSPTLLHLQMDDISRAADELQQQSGVFKRSAKTVKRESNVLGALKETKRRKHVRTLICSS